MKYLLKEHVNHDGKMLVKGSECPADFVEALLKKDLVLPVEEVVPANEEVKEVEEVKPAKKGKK